MRIFGKSASTNDYIVEVSAFELERLKEATLKDQPYKDPMDEELLNLLNCIAEELSWSPDKILDAYNDKKISKEEMQKVMTKIREDGK